MVLQEAPAEQDGQPPPPQQQQQQQPAEFLPICYQLRLNNHPRRRMNFFRACMHNAAIMGVSFFMLEISLYAMKQLAQQRMVKRK